MFGVRGNRVFNVVLGQGETAGAGPSFAPGIYETDRKKILKFACKDGYIVIKELQLEGKKRMKRVGNVEIPQEAFLAVLQIGK